MIRALKVLDGFATKLPAIGSKVFKFEKGLNVLFGPNGCGKSTVLNIAGAYSGTKGGWSSYIEAIWAKGGEYPAVMKALAPAGSLAEVEWDGTASFLMSPRTGDAPGSSIDDSVDGLLDSTDLIMEIMARPSAGQSRILRLNRMFDEAKKVPDLTKRPEKYEHVNDIWQGAMDKFVKHVKTLDREGPPTLLLDEVDQSISIPLQKRFWSEIAPALANKFQVIAATHSPFALTHRKANGFIDMVDGYADASVNDLKALASA